MQGLRYSNESLEAEGRQLQVTVITVRWWRRRRGRRWWQLPLIPPLLRVGAVGHGEGVGGAGAEAEGSQTMKVAGCPRQAQLGPLRRSHRAAVKLGLRQPRGDLQPVHGIQVGHERRVLDAGWEKERKSVAAERELEV